MGDITDRPKTPSQQVVYVPQYIYTPSTGTSGTSGTSTQSDDSETTTTPEQQREKNLLSRSRSRIGTIMTGFRGILATDDGGSQKKTLLGE